MKHSQCFNPGWSTGVARTSARSRATWEDGERACGPASLEAQLSMVARRLSHRVVAIGHFPPSSDSWHPTHSTHKFTRATAWGGAIPGVRSSDGWLLAHSRESAVALSIITVHCRQTRGNIGQSAPVPFYPSTVIEISDGMLVRATPVTFYLSTVIEKSDGCLSEAHVRESNSLAS